MHVKTVVLDGYTMNPGDLDWGALAALGVLEVHDRTQADQILVRCEGASAVLTNKTPLDAETIAALPELRYVGVLATGTNVVDLEAARLKGVTVTNVPAYSTPSVAQMVFAHLLNITQRVSDHASLVSQGQWAVSDDFSFTAHPQRELRGQTLGLLGYGAIGRAVAEIGRAFGMSVIVHTRRPPADDARVTCVDLDMLFRDSDVLSLHCRLTSETYRVVNADHLRLMKADAILINTGRGPLVDEAALADALREGRLAGAGLDVLDAEPPRDGSPLIGLANCWITPHIAWASAASRQRLLDCVVTNLQAFLAGSPINVLA